MDHFLFCPREPDDFGNKLDVICLIFDILQMLNLMSESFWILTE